MTLEELKAQLDSFSPAQIEFVARVVDSLANPPRTSIREHGTWLTGSPEWMEYFSLALSVHHGATEEPLGLTAFESVFRNACKASGWLVDPPGSATRRFVDLRVALESGSLRRLSLKSTAARRLSEATVHISKLTEAAWIQDERTPTGRRNRLRELFHSYRQEVDAILLLRAFRVDGIPHRYQLVEIPTALFDGVKHAPLRLFRSDAPSIPCTFDGQEAAVISVDRSDAKITVKRIRIASCVVHAEWQRV